MEEKYNTYPIEYARDIRDRVTEYIARYPDKSKKYRLQPIVDKFDMIIQDEMDHIDAIERYHRNPDLYPLSSPESSPKNRKSPKSSKSPKNKRPLNQYQMFMKEEIHRINQLFPDMDHKEVFKQAVRSWGKFKQSM